jgi:hypothetical protein
MAKDEIIITQTPPNLIGQPDVQLQSDSFDAFVYSKGYEVIHEKAVSCPCKSKSNNNPLSSCQNCNGSGWVIFNPTVTRMVLQGMNINTRYREWSQEMAGTVAITSRKVDQLSFMDRITVKDSDSIYSQVLHPWSNNNELFAFTIYDIKDIYEVFLFQAVDQPLVRLSSSNYSYERNKLILNASYGEIDDLSVSIRYKHWTEYHVIDILKETRRSYISDASTKGKQQSALFPFHAIARRSHYVLDPLNQTGSGRIDNSYEQ